MPYTIKPTARTHKHVCGQLLQAPLCQSKTLFYGSKATKARIQTLQIRAGTKKDLKHTYGVMLSTSNKHTHILYFMLRAAAAVR